MGSCCCTTQAANTPHPTKPLVRMCASGNHFPNFADIGDTVVLFVDFGHQFKPVPPQHMPADRPLGGATAGRVWPERHQSRHDVEEYEASSLIHFLLLFHFSVSQRYFGVPLLLAVEHQNSTNSPKTLQNGLRRGQTTKNRTRQ